MNRIITFFVLLLLLITLLIKDTIYGLIIKLDNNLEVKTTNIIDNYYNEEIKNMESILGFKLNNYSYTYSKVLIRNVYNFYNEITILKGKKDNIKKDSLVLNEYGLIGIIKEVNENDSIVTLVTSPNFSISVKVDNTYGILKYIDNELVVTNILDDNDYTNKEIYTSDLSKYLPNIYIGKVNDIKEDKLGLENKLIISRNDLKNIKYVLIVGNND